MKKQIICVGIFFGFFGMLSFAQNTGVLSHLSGKEQSAIEATARSTHTTHVRTLLPVTILLLI